MFYAERAPTPTRASSPRQLPTDHGHAVSTRGYQSDPSSRQLLRCHRPCCPKPWEAEAAPISPAASAYASLRWAPLQLRRLHRRQSRTNLSP
jgi:hypothetical protein